MHQFGAISGPGIHSEIVGTCLSEQRGRPGAVIAEFARVLHAGIPVGGIYPVQHSGFGIAGTEQSYIRQGCFEGVPAVNTCNIMPFGHNAQWLLVIIRPEIGENKADTSFSEDVSGEAECAGQTGSAVIGLYVEQFAENSQRMLPSLLRGQVLVHLVGEKQQSDAVVIGIGAECQSGAHFSDKFLTEYVTGAEEGGSADIHDKQDGQFAFFLKYFDVRIARPGSYIPVNRAHIVAELILPHLAERHAAAFEGAVIASVEYIPGETPCFDLHLSYASDEFCRIHNYFTNSPSGPSLRREFLMEE